MGSVALLFAGQGAQSVGMGQDLVEAYPVCRDLFAQADEVLGYKLSEICFAGPAEELTKTQHCQPAIFVMSAACLAALKQEQPELDIKASAGLSLGEWSALYAAGALSFEDTLRVLEARGRFMQEACDATDGGMVSVIGPDVPTLQAICEKTGTYLANLNSPGQTVISGAKEKLDDVAALAKEAGAKRAIVLNVAGGYHSPLMASAAPKLAEVLSTVTFNEPTIPVVANVTGAPHGGADSIAATMVEQVTGSVHWYEGIGWIKDQGIDSFLELGPGKVLSGLMRRIDRGLSCANIESVDSLKAAVAG
jgi:[acyl-carrier-protein] S-malonyltransferase